MKRTVEFVTIKPAVNPATGQPHRVPMPRSYGLPHGAALPEAGLRVPRDAFIKRLLRDKDADLVEPAAQAQSAPGNATAAKPTASGSAA